MPKVRKNKIKAREKKEEEKLKNTKLKRKKRRKMQVGYTFDTFSILLYPNAF